MTLLESDKYEQDLQQSIPHKSCSLAEYPGGRPPIWTLISHVVGIISKTLI